MREEQERSGEGSEEGADGWMDGWMDGGGERGGGGREGGRDLSRGEVQQGGARARDALRPLHRLLHPCVLPLLPPCISFRTRERGAVEMKVVAVVIFLCFLLPW